jgi:hypothetical protein
MNKLRCLLFVLCFVMPSSAFAYSCGNAKVVIDHPKYKYILMETGALYDMDANVIALSTAFMNSYSKNVQRFVFAHECGHYHLGGGTEIGADNYAIAVMKRNGAVLSERDLNNICLDVGPSRCSNIRKRMK